MFNKQNPATPQNATNTQQQNFNQEEDFKIEDFPIHTMSQDIYEIENPNKKIDILSENPMKLRMSEQRLTDKQKTSPFLNPATTPEGPRPEIEKSSLPNNEIAPQTKISVPPTPKLNYEIPPQQTKINTPPAPKLNYEIAQPQIKIPLPQAPKPIPAKKMDPAINPSDSKVITGSTGNKNGIFAIILALMILAVTGAGVYYFLATRQNQDVEIALPAPEPTPEPIIEPDPIKIEEPKLELSSSKPNFMAVDFENLDALGLKNTLNDFTKKVQDSNITTPVEFLLVDLHNNPIGFESFIKKIGLQLSSAVLGDLGSQFSLFIYNNQNTMRLGLAISSKNDAQLKIDMSAAEKTLVENLQPLFIPTEYKFNTAIFGTSLYNGTTIRYINATTTANLSIDYSIFNKQLVIGTSKMTERAILDYLQNNIVTSTNIKTVTPTQDGTAQNIPPLPIE